jgi:MFS family permease
MLTSQLSLMYLQREKSKVERHSNTDLLQTDIATAEVVDGGYGWVVVIAVFFVHVLVLGNIYSFGIFYPVYLDYFNASEASIAWIGSIGACLMGGLGIYTGKLSDYYGNNRMVFIGGVLIASGFLLASFANEVWQLYLTQGVIAGIGYSFAFIGGVSVVGPWFSKNRALAIGIAVSGSGLGQFAISQLTGAFINAFGWRVAIRILSLIEIVGLTVCSLLIKRKTELHAHWTGVGMDFFKNFHDKNFTFLFCSGLLVSLGMLVPFTYLPAYALQYNLSEAQSIFLVSIIGISSAAGRISTGFFADRIGKLFMLQVCYLGGGLTTLSWLLCYSFGSLLIFGLFFGFFIGGVISLMPSVAAELYGLAKIASILGVLYSSTAIGNLMSAPVGGYFLEGFHSYGPPIIASGSFQLAGFILVCCIRMPKKTTHQILPTAASDSNLKDLEGIKETDEHNLYESEVKEDNEETGGFNEVRNKNRELELVDIVEEI